MSGNKVLIVGDAGVGKKYLVERILGAERPELQLVANESKCLKCTWPIETKYYTASVDFWILPEGRRVYTGENDFADIAEDAQALAVVYDVHKSASLDLIKTWKTFIEQINLDVLLCVGSESQPDTPPQSHEAGRRWAAACGLEYIVMKYNTDKPKAIAADVSLVASADDDEGINRLVDALRCNMWQDLTLKEQREQQEPHDDGRDASQAEGNDMSEDTKSEPSVGSKKKKKKKKKKKRKQKVNTDGDGAKPTEDVNSEETETKADKSTPGVDAATGLASLLSGIQGSAHLEQDADDEFTRMFQKISQIRSEARSKSLPDSERRRRAEHAILELISAWNIDDEPTEDG